MGRGLAAIRAKSKRFFFMTTINVGLLVDPNTLKARYLFEHLCKSIGSYDSIHFTVITPKDINHGHIPSFLLKSHIVLHRNNISHQIDLENLSHLDLVVSFGWPHIVSGLAIKSLPRIVNIHGGSLPDYKGGSVYLHMWAHKEKVGEATAHVMTKNIDDGNILCTDKFSVSVFDSPKKILQKSCTSSVKVLKNLVENNLMYDEGTTQKGGRYFYSASKSKLIFYRIVNEFLAFFNRKLLLPHRVSK